MALEASRMVVSGGRESRDDVGLRCAVCRGVEIVTPAEALGVATLAAAALALVVRIARGKSPVRRLVDDLEEWRNDHE